MVIKNELFLTNTPGKPPFIGVVYNFDISEVVQSSDVDLLQLKDPNLDLSIEEKNNELHLTLQLRGFNFVRWYSCKFNKQHLLDWLSKVGDAELINFGHVIRAKDGTFQIAKDGKSEKSYYLPIKRLYVINSKDTKVVRIAKQKTSAQ